MAEDGARKALPYAFEEMGREELISVINPDNTASIIPAEKLGERYQRDDEVFGHKVSIYGISKRDWTGVNKA